MQQPVCYIQRMTYTAICWFIAKTPTIIQSSISSLSTKLNLRHTGIVCWTPAEKPSASASNRWILNLIYKLSECVQSHSEHFFALQLLHREAFPSESWYQHLPCSSSWNDCGLWWLWGQNTLSSALREQIQPDGNVNY